MSLSFRATLAAILPALLALAVLPAVPANAREIEPPEGLSIEEGEVRRTQRLDAFLATLREAYEHQNPTAIREVVHPEWGVRAWLHAGNIDFSVAASCSRSRSSLRRLAGEIDSGESWWEVERCPPLFGDELMRLGDPVRVKYGPPPHVDGAGSKRPYSLDYDIYIDRPEPEVTSLCGMECKRDGAYFFPYHFDYRLSVRTPATGGSHSLMFLFLTTDGNGRLWLTHAVPHPFAMRDPYAE